VAKLIISFTGFEPCFILNENGTPKFVATDFNLELYFVATLRCFFITLLLIPEYPIIVEYTSSINVKTIILEPSAFAISNAFLKALLEY
jgi:hypothetical protein